MIVNKARKTVEWTRFDEADPMLRLGGGRELRDVIRTGEVTNPVAVAPFTQSMNFRTTYYPFPIRAGFETGGGSEFVVADFNGDGRLDILMTYLFYPIEDRAVPVRLFTQQADGQFIDTTSIAFPNGVPAAVHPRQIVSGDFNGDGRTDAFIADHGLDGPPYPGAPNQLVLSTGATGLQSVQGAWSTITDFTHSAAVGDIDGDGDLDLFAGNEDAEADAWPYFLINGGLGNFTLSRSGLVNLNGADAGFTTSLLFDADSDGDLDLFLGPWDPRQRAAIIYENDGAGNFLTVLSTLDVPAHGSSENVIDSHALDLNGDGHLDLVINTVVDFNVLGSIRFYINDGTGHFTDETEIRLPSRLAQSWHARVDFADFDGDGFADMLVSSGATNPLFINDGSGVFYQLIGASPAPSIENDRIQFADANADGLMDIVAWRGQYGGAENLAIYFQQAVPASQTGTAEADGLLGDADADTLAGAGGDDRLFGSRGNDALDGGAGNDILIGGPGDDTLNGGEGDDLFKGGQGNDVYIVDQAGDIVTDKAGEGVDEIRTGLASFSLSGLANTENLSGGDVAQTLTGNGLGNILRGEGGNDTLFGLGGNDMLDGGAGDDSLDGGAGTDTMLGGTGNDTFIVDDAGDQVIEASGAGNDAIYAVSGYTLGAGQEIETLSTASNAGTAALVLVGNEFSQTLYGNAGANYLDGGLGNDTLVGFGGDDSYVVDDVNDYVAEFAGGGNDVVYVRGSFSLGAGQEVETLAAFSQAGTAPIVIIGNGFNQTLYGNAGANYLDGGSGNDTLVGFGGDDSYVVDDVNDYVAEFAGGGNDIVYVRGSFSLGAGQEVETLAAFSQTGTAPIVIIGNGVDQRLFGNNGDNYLDGGGGTDILQGFAGNDSYVVDSLGDYIVEVAGEGNDVVYARASYALGAGQSIEILSAISNSAGTAMDLTGNELGNQIYGSGGVNVLNGGLGADFLQGYGGADTFAFTTTLGNGNVDTILDFVSGSDRIALDDAIFGGIGSPGSFNANAFVTGTAAADADDRIIYSSATGELFYDADGNGGGAAVLVATLTGHPGLAASDFMVI